MSRSAWWLLALMAVASTRALADEPVDAPQSESSDRKQEAAEPEVAEPAAGAAEGVQSPAPASARSTPVVGEATARAGEAAASAASSEAPAGPAPANEHGPEPSPRPTTMEAVAEESGHELHFGHVKARYSLNFFGDVAFSVHSPAAADEHPSFSLGAQDILVRGELGNHFVATTEFALEFNDENIGSVDLERLHARWQDEHFFIEAGRTHTDLGYWNEAYHHGKWLQPSIDRPRWLRFEDEGGLLPVHWVGLNAGAATALGPGKIRISASIGNGRGKITDDVRNEYDYSGLKAFRAALEYTGLAGVQDLRIGLSGIYDRIGAQPASVRPSLPDVPIDEWIGGFHVAYPSVPVVAIAEAYLIAHRANGRNVFTYGGFALFGYAIGLFTPYVELSRILRSGGNDAFFIPDPSVAAVARDVLDFIVGLRMDVSDWSALKLEYGYTHMQRANHAVVLNWSWGF